jgi:hypothetical protein
MSPVWQATGLPQYYLRSDGTVSDSGRIGVVVALFAVAVVAAVLAAAGGAATSTTRVAGATRAPATTRTAATHSLSACAARALVVTVATNGASGKIQIYVGLRNRGRHACVVRGRATLALRDAETNRLLHVYGNPYARAVQRSLRRGPNTLFTLQWQNYCGPERPLLIVASFGKRQAVEHDDYPGARCELPDVPSELNLFHRPG